MTAIFRVARARWLLALLTATTLLIMPTMTFALFPPVISQPKATITSIPTPPAPPPKVTVLGDPGVPFTPPPTSNTPEPSTLVSCLLALVGFGVYVGRKRALAASA